VFLVNQYAEMTITGAFFIVICLMCIHFLVFCDLSDVHPFFQCFVICLISCDELRVQVSVVSIIILNVECFLFTTVSIIFLAI
jgi:hypothetical protein